MTAVEAAIGREITTTRSEPAFRLDRQPLARFRGIRSWCNLIIVADLGRPGDLAELAAKIVGPKLLPDFQSGRRVHAIYSDVWARGQTVLVVAGQGEEAIAARVATESDRLYNAFELGVTRQILARAYLAGEQKELRRDLEQRYGWSIRVPEGYRVGEDREARFVRCFRRERGAQLLFVHWQDGVESLPGPEACADLRARLIATYYDGDTMDSTRTRSEPADFLGRPAQKLYGVWQNAKYTMGGPFRTYCFVDQNRLVMVDLAVFEPMQSKVDLLRQLEAIALTFRDHRPSAG